MTADRRAHQIQKADDAKHSRASHVSSVAPRLTDSPQDHVEHVVRQLCVLGKAATLDFACAVGQLVIENFYGGDPTGWRGRDPHKDKSFRKLSRHPALPMSAVALYRSVCIYELCERLGVRTWRHVSTSHIRQVLSLPAPEQERLLRAAEESHWSVDRLDKEVTVVSAEKLGPDRAKGGRKRHSELVRALHMLSRASTPMDGALHAFDQTNQVALPEREARAAVALLQAIAIKCRQLEGRLACSLS